MLFGSLTQQQYKNFKSTRSNPRQKLNRRKLKKIFGIRTTKASSKKVKRKKKVHTFANQLGSTLGINQYSKFEVTQQAQIRTKNDSVR